MENFGWVTYGEELNSLLGLLDSEVHGSEVWLDDRAWTAPVKMIINN